MSGLGFKILEIIQRNHNLLPTYLRHIGLLNLLVYFANQNSIWWGFYWPARALFYHRGHTPWCVFLPNKLLHNSQVVGRIHGLSPNYVLLCARSCRYKSYYCSRSWLRKKGYLYQNIKNKHVWYRHSKRGIINVGWNKIK